LDGVQSVQADVNHPDEISTLFDPAIVYAKGGRLLVMVRKLIGEEAFRAGLKSYFEKFAYKNTVGNDLWQELESASGQPIVNLMNAWISQPGLPVVSVSNSHDAAFLASSHNVGIPSLKKREISFLLSVFSVFFLSLMSAALFALTSSVMNGIVVLSPHLGERPCWKH
jgi:aminopeptidase N